MTVYRALRNHQLVRDGAVRFALGDERRNLALASGQPAVVDLLRLARGSSFAVRRALADGKIISLVVEDLPGDAWVVGKELLRDRSRLTESIERSVGALGLLPRAEDASTATTVDEALAQARAGLGLDK